MKRPVLSRILLSLLTFSSSTLLYGADLKAVVEEISRCLANGKTSNSKTVTCKKLHGFLRKKKAHLQDDHCFLDYEWATRQSLKRLGLTLPLEVIPVAYVYTLGAEHSTIVVADWSYGQDSGPASKRQDAEWLSYKSRLVAPGTYWDGGSFNKLHFFTKNSATAPYQLTLSLNVTAEPVSSRPDPKRPGTAYDSSLDAWFKTSETRNCTGGDSDEKKVFLCLTNFWSKDWPEVHYWEDTRASTGIVITTFFYKNGKYQSVNSDRGYYCKEGNQFAFAAPPTGEGYNDKWSYASPAAVLVWNSESQTLERSDALSQKVFPVTEKKLGTDAGDPTTEGYYLDKQRSLFRFVK